MLAFLQEHPEVLGSATLGAQWIDVPTGELGMDVTLGALMLFSPSPGTGSGAGYQWHWSIPGATRGTRTAHAVALLCFYGAACSLPFPEGGIAESEAVHPSGETFWRTPASSPTPPQSNIVLPQKKKKKNLTGQDTAGLERPLRSAGLCIPLGLPGGSWTGFLLNQAQSMLKEGLF